MRGPRQSCSASRSHSATTPTVIKVISGSELVRWASGDVPGMWPVLSVMLSTFADVNGDWTITSPGGTFPATGSQTIKITAYDFSIYGGLDGTVENISADTIAVETQGRRKIYSIYETRYADGRLDQVKRFTAENNELDLPAATFDAVTMILCYHDIYHVDEKNGWTKIDGPALLGEIYQAMKPGAVLGVVAAVAIVPRRLPQQRDGVVVGARGEDAFGYRAEAVTLMRLAEALDR